MDIHCIDENGKESVIAKDAFMLSISPNEKYMLAEKKTLWENCSYYY